MSGKKWRTNADSEVKGIKDRKGRGGGRERGREC